VTTFDLTVGIVAGLAALFVSRPCVGFVLSRIAPWDQALPPKGVAPEDWMAAVRGTGAKSASWLGGLECLLAYVATVAFSGSAGPIIGGWMAFKVASKWESWQNVVRVPETLTESNVSQLDFLRARRQWAALLYTRFLCGTLLNVLIGVLLGLMALAMMAP